MYGVVAYYFGKTAAEIPVLIIFPTIFSLIIYWMIGLNDTSGERFAIFCKKKKIKKYSFFIIRKKIKILLKFKGL